MKDLDERFWKEVTICIWLAVAVLTIVYFARRYHDDYQTTCTSAGGIAVDMHCINPSAVIEVDK